MKLNDLKDKYEGSLSDELLDQNLVKGVDEWGYYSSVSLNGIIATGWLSNDDILVINGDGTFIYDIQKKAIVFADYDDATSFKKYISDDNLTFVVQSRSETVSVFGLRGGGGNLLTKDNFWKLEVVNIAWNIRVPRLSNNRIGKEYFIELTQNFYEGYMYLGFSKSEKYFVIMGDGGLDVFLRKIH